MTPRSSMIHRAVVERNMAPGLDAFGNERPQVWGTHVDGLPCRYWQQVIGGMKLDDTHTVVLYEHRLMIPVDTDMVVGDRISRIRNRLGWPILTEMLDVVAVIRKPTHLLVRLESSS